MKKKILIPAIVAAIVIAAGYYLWGPSKAPAGQQPLTRLAAANFSEFESAFDAGADRPRVLLQVSPT
jgi:hypothetical protein